MERNCLFFKKKNSREFKEKKSGPVGLFADPILVATTCVSDPSRQSSLIVCCQSMSRQLTVCHCF